MHRKERKQWQVIVMFWQKGQKTVMETCGIIAGRFPVLRVDMPRYAPTTPQDGAGWETRASV